jgi:hypothetical protein
VCLTLLGNSRTGFAAFDASYDNLATWGVRCGQHFFIGRGPQAGAQGVIVGTHWGRLYRLLEGEKTATPFDGASVQAFHETYDLYDSPLLVQRSGSICSTAGLSESGSGGGSARLRPMSAHSRCTDTMRPPEQHAGSSASQSHSHCAGSSDTADVATLPFDLEPIAAKCALFVTRRSAFRFRVRSGEVFLFDVRDSVCRGEFGFSHGEKVMMQSPANESGKVCVILGVREKKLWKVDDRETVASCFLSARDYADLVREYGLSVIGKGHLKEFTG